MTLKRMMFSGVLAFAACAAISSGQAIADPAYDSDLNNGVYFGTGNVDGGWTVTTTSAGGDDLEIGLRAKYYDGAVITPEPGTGVYDTVTGLAPGHPTRAAWNWEFSIDNLAGTGLTGLTAFITITSASGLNNSTVPLDLLAIGDNFKLGTNGVQNSENMLFGFLPGYSPWAGDSYTYTVNIDQGSNLIASDTITINAVPEPASIALLGLGLTGLGAIRRRRR